MVKYRTDMLIQATDLEEQILQQKAKVNGLDKLQEWSSNCTSCGILVLSGTIFSQRALRDHIYHRIYALLA